MNRFSRVVHWTALFLFVCALPVLFYSTFQIPKGLRADNGITYDFPRWEWKNPKPTGNNLKKTITCSGIVWAVGSGGTVLKSVDNGITYSQGYTGVTNTLNDIVCFSQSNMVAIGSGGRILQYDGASWTNRAPALTSQLLNSVTVSSTGKFVAVGASGTILYSTDGTNWTIEGDGLTSQLLNSVTVSSTGKFVAAGVGGIILYSTDGTNWTIEGGSLTNNTLYSVVVSPATNQFVAVGASGTVLYSDDGTSWILASKPAGLTTQNLNNITVSSTGKFVAVGASGMIIYSTDGANWTIGGAGETAQPLNSVTVSSTGKFVAVGASGIILYSAEGTTWLTEGAGETTQSLYGVTVMPAGQFAAVGDSGTILYSLDGTAWSIKGTSLTVQVFNHLAVSSMGKFVAVGADGTILYSADGTDWEAKNVGLTDQVLKSVTVSTAGSTAGNFVAVGYSGTILYSADGTSWSIKDADLPAQYLWSVTSSATGSTAGQFVAVGDSGTILYSADGLTWLKKETGLTARWLNSVTASTTTGQFVAVGDSGTILYSADGIDWTITDQPTGLTTQNLNSVTVSSTGRFVAVGNSGIILDSSDGINWTTEGAGQTTQPLYSVTVSSTGRFVAVGDNGTILYSEDGVTWSIKGADLTVQALKSIAVSSTGQFVAVGYNGTILDSLNGITWLTKGAGETAQSLYSVAASPSGQFVAVGNSGTVLRYSAPATAVATNLLVQNPGQGNFIEDSTGISGTSNIARVGVEYKPKIYSVEKYVLNSETRYRLAKAAYQVRLSSNDPNASNTANFNLNNNIEAGCNDPEARDIVHDYCGVYESSYTFHTLGTWTIAASDTGGSSLIAGNSASITVLPGVAHNARFSISSIATAAGVAKEVVLGLADSYGNATSDPSGKTIRLSSNSTSAQFSASANGPWSNVLDIAVPAGDPAVLASENKTVSFFYLDFSPTASTVTASDPDPAGNLASSVLPVTISEGAIDQSNSNISVSSSNPKVGETIIVTVSVSTTSSNPVLSLYSSRAEDVITKLSNSNGVATFSVYSTKAGSLNLSAKDDTDNTWLGQRLTIAFVPAAVSRVDVAAVTSKDVVAGVSFSLKASFYDRFDNLTSNSGDRISISSNDDQAAFHSALNLSPANDLGKYTFGQITLKSAGDRIITVKDETTGSSSSIGFSVYAAVPSVDTSLFETTKRILILDKEKADLKITLFDLYKNPIAGKTTKIQNDTSIGSINNSEIKTDSNGQSKFVYTPIKEGKDTLTAFMPDNDDPTKNVAFSEKIIIENKSNTLSNNISSLVDSLQNNTVAKNIADVAKKVVQATVALGFIPLVANIIGGAPAAFHAINYGISLTLEALGIRRKRKNWGKVFDSTTGKGVDMALVRLYNQDTMQLKDTIVTDIKGQYHFSPQPGVYALSVSKDGYAFPTEIFAKYGVAILKNSTSRVNNQYVGQPINIGSVNNLLNIDVPMDPVMPKISLFLKIKIVGTGVFSFLILSLPYIVIPTLVLGSLLSVFTALVKPELRNIVLSIIYIALTLGYIFSRVLRFSHTSVVLDSETKKPIEGVMVSLFEKEHNDLKESRITDHFGRFSIYAPKGHYYLKAQKSGYKFDIVKKEKKDILLREASFIRMNLEGRK